MPDLDQIIGLAALNGVSVKVHGANAARHAIVKDGAVVNVILVDLQEFPEWTAPEGGVAVPCPDWVSAGCTHGNGTFADPRARPKQWISVAEARDKRVREIDAAFQKINASLLVNEEEKSAARQDALTAIDRVRAGNSREEIWEIAEVFLSKYRAGAA